jgi:Xaa-Pro aminopeptidase
MSRERAARLRAAMSRHDVEALLLLGPRNVEYATGVPASLDDPPRARLQATAALLVADDPALLLAEVARRSEMEVVAWVRAAIDASRRLRLGVDECSPQLYEELGRLPGVSVVDAGPIVGDARVVKTADELECIRQVQRINETAAREVRSLVAAGLPENRLSGSLLRRVRELGGTACVVEPTWQSTTVPGPRTRHGQPAYPAPTTGRRLASGDVLWVDTGIALHGYCSDLGRTWLVGDDAGRRARHRQDFARWREVTDSVLAAVHPGASAGDLVEAARRPGDGTPWLRHLYLGHGLGQQSSEPPLIGTEGSAGDVVLAAGMVLVLEPVVWEEGRGGYRAEEVVAVTESGWTALSERIASADD